jgi:DNA helicase-2/ATP-dependent DNA helicase PcrA
MNMYKSKGKEFDAVIIVEGRHQAKLLDPDWDATRTTQRRRVLRVAITRARDMVVFMRPRDAAPLTP